MPFKAETTFGTRASSSILSGDSHSSRTYLQLLGPRTMEGPAVRALYQNTTLLMDTGTGKASSSVVVLRPKFATERLCKDSYSYYAVRLCNESSFLIRLVNGTLFVRPFSYSYFCILSRTTILFLSIYEGLRGIVQPENIYSRRKRRRSQPYRLKAAQGYCIVRVLESEP